MGWQKYGLGSIRKSINARKQEMSKHMDITNNRYKKLSCFTRSPTELDQHPERISIDSSPSLISKTISLNESLCAEDRTRASIDAYRIARRNQNKSQLSAPTKKL
jgi:predicted nucleic-acid-binding Zn-ribbon protein